MFRQPVGRFQPFGDQGRGAGRQRPHWPYGQHAPEPREWHHMRGSINNPPPWAPEMEEQYPFRDWLADVVAWCNATTMDEVLKGPQLELALGGVARSLVRELPLQAKKFGADVDLGDGAGPQRLSGAAYILQALAGKFMPLDDEMNLRALADLYGFARLGNENIDTMLTRWEVVMQRARTRAGIAIQPHHAAWMLLLALRIPGEYWVHVLTPFQGQLPTTEQQYRQFVEYLKRFGHLAESGSHNIMQGATMGPTVFPTADAGSSAGGCIGGGCGMFPMFSAFANQDYNNNDYYNDYDGTYYYDDDGDSDTSDDGGDEPDMVLFEREDDEPDMSTWSANEIGEFYYQRYRRYRKKWRRFTGRAPRRYRSRAKGKGKGRYNYEQEAMDTFFGKGKGGKGKGKAGNPFGRDGQRLKCSICGSDQHLRAVCPRRGDQRNASSSTPSPTAYASATTSTPTPSAPTALFNQGPLAGLPFSHGMIRDAAGDADGGQPHRDEGSQLRERTPRWLHRIMQDVPAASAASAATPAAPMLPPGWWASLESQMQQGQMQQLRSASTTPAVSRISRSTALMIGQLAPPPTSEPTTPTRRTAASAPASSPATPTTLAVPSSSSPALLSSTRMSSQAVAQIRALPPPPESGSSQGGVTTPPTRTAEGSPQGTPFVTPENEGWALVPVQIGPTPVMISGRGEETPARVHSSGEISASPGRSERAEETPTSTLPGPTRRGGQGDSAGDRYRANDDDSGSSSSELIPADVPVPEDPWIHGDPWMQNAPTSSTSPTPASARTSTLPTLSLQAASSSTGPSPSTAIARTPRDNNESNCVICLGSPATTKLQPCGHLQFCLDCAGLIVAGAVSDPAVCPLCRHPVSGLEQAPEEAMQEAVVNERVQVTPMMDTVANVLVVARLQQRAHHVAQPVSGRVPSTALISSMQALQHPDQHHRPMRLNTLDFTFGPWWPVEEQEQPMEVYLEKLMLSNDEVGLMPDTGAHDGLCGSNWARALATRCQRYGKEVRQEKLAEPKHVAGVGQGSQRADFKTILTTGMVDTSGQYWEEKFEAPCLPDSNVPGLMGIKTMEENDALIRCKTGEIWFLGKGGVKIEPSPGSRHFQMKKTGSGHWAIPVSRFRRGEKAKTAQMTMTTTATSSSSSSTAFPGTSSSSSGPRPSH